MGVRGEVGGGGVSVTGCGPSRGVTGSKIGHRINTCSCKIARV